MLEEEVVLTVNLLFMQQGLFSNCGHPTPPVLSMTAAPVMSYHITERWALQLQRVIICLENNLTYQELFYLEKLNQLS